MLSAYRKGQGCSSLITKMVTKWKMCLDKGEKVGILTTDLSTAFDCLPKSLFIAKLRAYNLSLDACHLIGSQMVKYSQIFA